MPIGGVGRRSIARPAATGGVPRGPDKPSGSVTPSSDRRPRGGIVTCPSAGAAGRGIGGSVAAVPGSVCFVRAASDGGATGSASCAAMPSAVWRTVPSSRSSAGIVSARVEPRSAA